MVTFLSYAFYVILAVLVVVLALGLINLVRTDDDRANRSNKLMRMRVIVQAVLIAILVLLGAVAGAISF